MNKALIKKYKQEFEHWLAGGEILYKHKNSLAWWTTNCWQYSLDYVQAIIINDQYVELRKSLALGETIQLKKKCSKEWEDIPCPEFNCSLESYRIKPKSPFSAGDWVRDTRLGMKRPIVQLQPDCLALTNPEEDDKHFIRWEPLIGEWCWFWNNDKSDIKFKQLYIIIYEVDTPWKYETMDRKKYTNCEPFIGTLPSILKN